MSFYDEEIACVRVRNMVMGLRQGCEMSPWLFDMFMDGVARELSSRVNEMGVKLSEFGERERMLCQLLFADDNAVVAQSAEQQQCLVRDFLQGV